MAKKRYYLAYGSNLNMNQMAFRCPNAVPVGTAEINGYRLMFKGSKSGNYLTIEKAKGESVPVGVWMVDAADEKALDRYEGYPVFYYKKRMMVNVEDFKDGKKWNVEAFVYIMHEDHKFGIPSLRYVETCADGYDDFGFDTSKLVEAIRFSYQHLDAA